MSTVPHERFVSVATGEYLILPDTDGMTTLQRCRAEPDGKNVRAVMLTADSRLATLERALALGFDEFLPKPVLDQDEFVQR